jgi:hypothetical protein
VAKVVKKEFDPAQAVYGRFGPSTHLSAKEKRERKLTHLDPDLMLGGGAFSPKIGQEKIDLPPDVAKTFANYYERTFK